MRRWLARAGTTGNDDMEGRRTNYRERQDFGAKEAPLRMAYPADGEERKRSVAFMPSGVEMFGGLYGVSTVSWPSASGRNTKQEKPRKGRADAQPTSEEAVTFKGRPAQGSTSWPTSRTNAAATQLCRTP